MKTYRTGSLVLAALVGSSSPGVAEIVTFTLNPAQSTVAISGSVSVSGSSAPFQDQGPGSRTGRFGGTLKVDVSANSIEFKLGSFIDAVTNGVWSPMPNGAAGTAPADFGAQASLLGGFAMATAALRNIILDATNPVISLQGTSFNSSGLVFQFPTSGTASLDYRVTGAAAASGSEKLETLGTNNVTTMGSLVNQGGTQTLTVPVNATFKFDLLSPGDTTLILTGNLVATRSLSQPAVFDAGSITVNASTITLHWQGAAGQTFRIEGSTNLVNWSNRVTNITSANTDYSWTGTPIGPTEYFRLAQ